MNPTCYRCKKTVYPVDKLSCLDKLWHKGCFNCETCSMTLSMKTYKGFGKLPFCNTHYPKQTFTAVADTPENLRLKKNTNIQSNLVYHSEFERDKGKFTTVADDPETLRNAKTQRQASDLAYQRKDSTGVNVVLPQGNAPRYAQDQQRHPSYSDQQRQQSFEQQKQQSFDQQRKPSEPSPEPVRAAPQPAKGGAKYIAIYDYTAADDDEVSFSEGDVIMNGETIDDGWMTGTVQRTGQTGMLPSNYVESM